MNVPATEEAVRTAVAAAEAADDVKASDLRIFDVSDVLALVDVFVVATASSDRQLRAVTDRIESRMRDEGRRPLHREGTAEAGWLLLDFGDVVCHVFDAEHRAFYALERLWSDVPERDPITGVVISQGTPRSVDTSQTDALFDGGE